MALSMHEKQHVGKEAALRYLRARKKEKGVMLQEFCATTGYRPPYAAFLLRTYAKRVILGQVTLVPTRPSPWRIAASDSRNVESTSGESYLGTAGDCETATWVRCTSESPGEVESMIVTKRDDALCRHTSSQKGRRPRAASGNGRPRPRLLTWMPLLL